MSMPGEMQESNPKTNLGAARERFAAGVLELEAVLELFSGLASSSLGRRALAELEPRVPDEARRALERTSEAVELARKGEAPNLAGFADPFPPSKRDQRILEEADFVRLLELLGAASLLREWALDRDEEAPQLCACLLYTSPSPRDRTRSRMPSSA